MQSNILFLHFNPHSQVIRSIPEGFWSSNLDVTKETIKRHPKILFDMPGEIIGNDEIVMSAIKQYGDALYACYANPLVSNHGIDNKELVLTAIDNQVVNQAFQFVSPRLQDDIDVLRKFLSKVKLMSDLSGINMTKERVDIILNDDDALFLLFKAFPDNYEDVKELWGYTRNPDNDQTQKLWLRIKSMIKDQSQETLASIFHSYETVSFANMNHERFTEVVKHMTKETIENCLADMNKRLPVHEVSEIVEHVSKIKLLDISKNTTKEKKKSRSMSHKS